MSIEAMAWVLEHERTTSGTTRMILLCIASHADKRGDNSWPSLATLAEEANVSRESAWRCVKRLADAGVITREVNEGGTRKTHPAHRPNLYSIPGVRRGVPHRESEVSTPHRESEGGRESEVGAHRESEVGPTANSRSESSYTSIEPSTCVEPSLFESEGADRGPVAPDGPAPATKASHGEVITAIGRGLYPHLIGDDGDVHDVTNGAQLATAARKLLDRSKVPSLDDIEMVASYMRKNWSGSSVTPITVANKWDDAYADMVAKRQRDAEMDAKRASWGQRRGGRGAPPPPPQPTDDGTVMVTIEVAPPDATPVRLEDGHIPIYERVPVEVECRKDAEGDLVPVACMPPKETIESKALRAAWRRWLKAKGIPESVLGGWIYWGEANTAWVAEHYPELGEVTHVSAIGIELGLCPWTGGPPDWCGVPLTREVGKFVMARRRERVSPEWLDNARKWWHELLHSVDHLPRYATPEGPSTTERSCPMVPWGYWQRAGLESDPA